ncbi:MAG TPA: hypothetical protein VK817_06065 [Trebonia sp.]|jgi:hypothetical protein|nr:hypothetical protein [Trebonia sp.]
MPAPGALLAPYTNQVMTENQADAGVPAGDRDFTGYIANVLFDDWDEVWADAARAGEAAAIGDISAILGRIPK